MTGAVAEVERDDRSTAEVPYVRRAAADDVSDCWGASEITAGVRVARRDRGVLAQVEQLVELGDGGPACRIAIVDDHQMLVAALHSWLAHEVEGVEVAIATSSWAELFTHPSFPVDVVLLDYDLKDGLPAPVKIASLAAAGVRTVVISTLAEPAAVHSCLKAGACSYLPKSEPAEEIVQAVRAAARGEGYLTPALATALLADVDSDVDLRLRPRLSPQELRALLLYASGLPMKSVAKSMGISFDTARCYIDRVRDKYSQAGREARSKIELHQRALEDGLLPATR